ncbi:peptidyl-prolyl cis-trans isomerase D [Enhydrobacter aerosaccus]|uniref:Parvulin-like PPIase n=1 Tax=Enhydrobacter aerosaccus TaxID=225324 RepID=A0A1T4L013_9HYPH|nr:peptidylprolyl isomerase [Enhydrobacter aerosaccus]SJZ48026.1 peptidyl-prolyl cis-trans isomerase D [Enhydrobacter aerosaccus]
MNKFRKYASYIIMSVLLGMLIISFALWGIGDMLRMGGQSNDVAHVGGFHVPVYGWVGGTSVSIQDVRDRFNRQLDQIQRQTGQRPDPDQAVRYGLNVRALEDVVQRAVIDQAMNDYGIVVSDAQVRQVIAQNPAFQGAGNKFDPMKYRNLLQQARINEASYVADVRREIGSTELFGTVRTEGIGPKSLRDDIFKMESEKRIGETIYVPDSIVTDVPKPTAEQLGTYFDANKARFQIPEYRAFSYVLLTTNDVMDQVSVTPDQVKQEYDSRAAEFGAPEKRDVDQAMTDSEDKAKAIIAAVKEGKSLEEAAKQVTGSADGVIKLGLIQKKDLPAGPLADGIFSLPEGVASEPIKSPLGWHVVRINKIEAGKVTPFDEVKDKLEKDLKAQAAPDLLVKLANDFDRELGKGQSMADAAKALGLKVVTVENVDARGQDQSGKQVVIGPAAAELVQAAFSTREGSDSDLLETPKGEYFIVHTDRITPSRTPALSEVEAKVAQAWEAEQRRKMADQKVKELVDKANAGGDLPALAKELGLELRTTKVVTRFDSDTGNYLSQPVTQALFKLAVGKVQAVRTADGNVIVRAKEIQPADLAKAKDQLDRFGTQLDTMIANDLVAQLLAALRAKYGVQVNEQVFQAAFQSQQPQ